jgi:hypothetical protein
MNEEEEPPKIEPEIEPLIGPGFVQWGEGIWFGLSIGGVCWMLGTGLFLMSRKQFLLGVVPLIPYAVVMVMAFRLWWRRDRVLPFPALMGLLGTLGVSLPIVWYSILWFASPKARFELGFPRAPWQGIVISLIAPVLILFFASMEWRYRKRGETVPRSVTDEEP